MTELAPVAAARTALAAAGFPESTPATAGFTVTPLDVIGVPRAAVTWQPPGVAPGADLSRPGPELARCQQALTRAGCLCSFTVAAGGGHLTVLPPADGA